MATKSNENLTDQQLTDMICHSDATRKSAIEYIYRWDALKLKVQHFVQTRGGTSSESLDIYHEGIIVLDRNIRTGRYKSDGSLQGYLYSICRFLWQNERRKSHRNTFVETIPENNDVPSPDMQLFKEERRQVLEKVLQMLDDSCRKILKLWKLSYSMAEIASILNLSSPQLAKKYKYRCLKKLLLSLDKEPSLLEALRP
ncbi:MAG: sigma-70 family RNA polymerase sigma factor [Saprospiraceae bacterium]|nr:sigma-70 family RNA polymerase sigma factor [Saprospiraceae bacterium]